MRREENLKRRKKTIIISSVIAGILIILIVILTIVFVNIRKNNNKQEVENKEDEVTENTEENELDEADQDEEIAEENIEINQEGKYNVVDDEIDYIDPRVGVDKKTLEKEKEKEKIENENIEKAKKIVRKDWGNDNSVSIVYDNYKDEKGRYVIKIRDKQTHEIATYHVNIDNGTFEKQITKGDF